MNFVKCHIFGRQLFENQKPAITISFSNFLSCFSINWQITIRRIWKYNHSDFFPKMKNLKINTHKKTPMNISETLKAVTCKNCYFPLFPFGQTWHLYNWKEKGKVDKKKPAFISRFPRVLSSVTRYYLNVSPPFLEKHLTWNKKEKNVIKSTTPK